MAEGGGYTTFTKSDITVRPRNYGVTFFSYWDASNNLMDPESLTEHSGCPITEGEKWITTFWMREGVTQNDPWTNFDPSGLRLMSQSIRQASERDETTAIATATAVVEEMLS